MHETDDYDDDCELFTKVAGIFCIGVIAATLLALIYITL